MGTVIEIVITALLTFGAGFLFLKYKSDVKYKVKRRKLGMLSAEPGQLQGEPDRLTVKANQLKSKSSQFSRNTSLKRAYRDYSPKFILIILLAMTFFSSVFYLAERGIIILKW